MCGLVAHARIGVDAGHDAETETAELAIRTMLPRVAHRGPDADAVLLDERVSLGFTRLSLVSPDDGDQPLHSADQRYVLIANGEVYNFRRLMASVPGADQCRTGSDCEVLLYLYAHYGVDFLNHIDGMISVIIWDRVRNELVLARDPFGLKPLFFHQDARRVVASSEIKGLMGDPDTPRKVDWTASLAASTLHGVPMLAKDRAVTWFKSIEMVQAGSTVVIDLATGARTVHQAWHPSSVETDQRMTAEQYVDDFGSILRRSVGQHRDADAEVGLLLSGGVDSSAIAAMCEPGMHTFTLLSGSTYRTGDAAFARQVADGYGHANYQLLVPNDHTPTLDQWMSFLCLVETPQASMEAYLKFLLYGAAKQVRPELRGMMMGTGADEFAGGYSSELSGGKGWDGFEDNLGYLVRQTRRTSQATSAHWLDRAATSFINPARLDDLAGGLPYDRFVERKYYDVEQYNTWVEDRAASGFSIEGRGPFLDRELIELTLAVPPHLRSTLLWDKSGLRRAVAPLLPPELAQREKVPFFHGPHENYTYDVIVRMMTRDNFAFLRTAFGIDSSPVSVTDAIAWVEQLRRRPNRSGVEFLLRIANLALLDRLASTNGLGLFDGFELPEGLEVVDFADLPQSTPPELADPVQPFDALYHVGEGYDLVSPVSGNRLIYVALNGEFANVIDDDVDAWTTLLRLLESPMSIAAMASNGGLPGAQVRAMVDQGLAAGFIVIADDPA